MLWEKILSRVVSIWLILGCRLSWWSGGPFRTPNLVTVVGTGGGQGPPYPTVISYHHYSISWKAGSQIVADATKLARAVLFWTWLTVRTMVAGTVAIFMDHISSFLMNYPIFLGVRDREILFSGIKYLTGRSHIRVLKSRYLFKTLGRMHVL